MRGGLACGILGASVNAAEYTISPSLHHSCTAQYLSALSHLLYSILPSQKHKQVRYVIDFYNAAPLPGMPVAMHLDVRPALDSPGAAWDRAQVGGNMGMVGPCLTCFIT